MKQMKDLTKEEKRIYNRIKKQEQRAGTNNKHAFQNAVRNAQIHLVLNNFTIIGRA